MVVQDPVKVKVVSSNLTTRAKIFLILREIINKMTKKYLVIGDIHGRDHWKYSIEKFYDEADHIVFIGDYVDSFHLPFTQIAKNLEEIIKFKRENMEVCTLLLGNHDVYSDYFGGPHNFSGFNHLAAPLYSAIFDEHRELFQIAHRYGRHLFTHAGIVSQWWDELCAKYPEFKLETIEDNINSLLKDSNHMLYMCGPDRGGVNRFSGPLWSGWNELQLLNLTDFVHHVGHTQASTFIIRSPVFTENIFSGDLYKYDFIPGGDNLYEHYPLIEINEHNREVKILNEFK